MCRVRSESEDCQADRENRVACSRYAASRLVYESTGEEENQHHCRSVDEKETQVNSPNCLSKKRHNERVRGIRSGKFHVIGELVRWDALQYELAGISVLALVTLQGDFQKTNPDCENETKNDYCQSPPCKPHEAVVDLGLTHHESSYLDEKPNVATKGGARNFG